MSAGFDGHRADPLTDLGLTAGDFALLTARARSFVPAGRCIAMLEGGYDLDALAACATATLGALAGVATRPGGAEQRRPGRRGGRARRGELWERRRSG